MKKIIGFLFLLFLFNAGKPLKAQYYNGKVPRGGKMVTYTEVGKDDLHLRWYPLGLINFYDLNLTFGAEYSYTNNKSFILDAGYIMASIYGNETGDLQPASGFMVKTAHRWYYGRRRNHMFVDAEAGFKAVRYKSENQWVGRGVVGGTPAYEELMTVTSRKDVFTLGARVGKRVTFSPTSPMGMEFWWGLGIRYRHYYPDLPDDAQIQQFRGWFINPMDYDESWLPDIQVGMRLTLKATKR
jgi:hypothetical protein